MWWINIRIQLRKLNMFHFDGCQYIFAARFMVHGLYSINILGFLMRPRPFQSKLNMKLMKLLHRMRIHFPKGFWFVLGTGFFLPSILLNYVLEWCATWYSQNSQHYIIFYWIAILLHFIFEFKMCSIYVNASVFNKNLCSGFNQIANNSTSPILYFDKSL